MSKHRQFILKDVYILSDPSYSKGGEVVYQVSPLRGPSLYVSAAPRIKPEKLLTLMVDRYPHLKDARVEVVEEEPEFEPEVFPEDRTPYVFPKGLEPGVFWYHVQQRGILKGRVDIWFQHPETRKVNRAIAEPMSQIKHLQEEGRYPVRDVRELPRAEGPRRVWDPRQEVPARTIPTSLSRMKRRVATAFLIQSNLI